MKIFPKKTICNISHATSIPKTFYVSLIDEEKIALIFFSIKNSKISVNGKH